MIAITDQEFPLRIVYDKFFNELIASYKENANQSNKAKNFKQVLQHRSKFWSDPRNDHMNRVQTKIVDIREKMIENVDKIIVQNEQLEIVREATEELNDESEVFGKNAKRLKHSQSWWWWIYAMITE